MNDAIDAYERGAQVPARAIEGLADADVDATPIPGTWSIRQIVVHLLESELAAVHRMRRIAGENVPLLIAYDESALATNLHYERCDLTLVTRMFADLRLFTAAWLRTMPPEAFTRVGIHNQRGKISLAEMVRMYVAHLEGHMTHLRKKRDLLGKPLN